MIAFGYTRIDGLFEGLPDMLVKTGMALKQKERYKAGKLSCRRNWCQLVDGDVPLKTRFPNTAGHVRAWKLFARFNPQQLPSWPWDKPEPYEHKKAQWMIAGDDVWGISYEAIREWLQIASAAEVMEKLVRDLRVAHLYCLERYC